jgi:uncharacterized protein
MSADVLGSGIAFPLRIDHRGGLALSRHEQDISEAIWLILSTAPGERPMRPSFGCGIHNHVFESLSAEALGRFEYEIRVALSRWEPRIDVISVAFDIDRVGAGELAIDVAYRVRDTSDVRNLVFPFYVIPGEGA